MDTCVHLCVVLQVHNLNLNLNLNLFPSFFLQSGHFIDLGFSPVLSLAFGLALLLYAFLIELHRFCGACTSFPLLHLINFWCFQFLDYFLVISRACC